MKVLHICLGEHYVDGYGYQENVLTKLHKQLGCDVKILASTETLVDQQISYLMPSEYINEYGIPVTRIPYVSWMPHKLVVKLRIYKNIRKELVNYHPDILFIHGASFLSVRQVVKYAKENKVKLIVDSHSDYINSGRNWLSKNILHHIIYRYCYQSILPYTLKFYGTLPVRCKYLNEVFHIPKDRIEYLPMGIDLAEADYRNRNSIRREIRTKYGISENDFVVVSGGKLEKKKNTIELMESVQSIRIKDIKLFLFGSVSKEIKEDFENILSQSPKIVYAGWVNAANLYKYLLVGDLAIFPGTHSSIWEQTVGLGLPCIFKYWDDITQIDLGGNCILLDQCSSKEIAKQIEALYYDCQKLQIMKKIAEEKGPKMFSYREIAQRCLA